MVRRWELCLRRATLNCGGWTGSNGSATSSRDLVLLLLAETEYLALSLGVRGAAELCPFRHDPATPLKQVAATIGGFHLVAHCMCQRHLGDFARKIGALCGPITERRAKAMRGQIIMAQASQQHQQRHI